MAKNSPKVYNNTRLIFIGPEYPTVRIKSKVPYSGRYTILIKFYQPNYSAFDIMVKIDADKLTYDAKLQLRNCPSISGCREIIVQSDGIKSFELEDNATITFTVIYRIISILYKNTNTVFPVNSI